MSASAIEKNNKKIINAWCMYDWANSVYSLTITTAVFPIYFNAVTNKDGNNLLNFLWMTKENSVVYTYSLSLAFLIIAFLNPLLSGIADYSGNKKAFMRFFAYLGSISCMLLYFFDGKENAFIGILFFITATIGYAGSLVFYNAYLPEIATPDRFDKISAKGFSLGYIGSVLLLIGNLILIQKPEWFGMVKGTMPARVSFLSVGIWWFGFSHYTFSYLSNRVDGEKKKFSKDYFFKGFRELNKVFNELKNQVPIKIFLISFFFYSMGFQTIMYLASVFGSEELKMPESGLIITILIIQIVAIGGAYLFNKLSVIIGNIKTLTIAVGLCTLICVGAYFVNSADQFYSLAVVVGVIMGGLQSLSRSTYSKFLPDTKDHASYFSFYEFCEKVGIVLGTITYGLVKDLTGDMRNSIFALFIFFVIALLLMTRIQSLKNSYKIETV